MHNDQTTQDAKRLLAAISTNHAEARMATRMGWTDRSPQAGLTRSRRDSIGSAATPRCGG